MTIEERKAVAKALVEEAKGKVPLVIAAQHTDPRQVIELCRYAEDLGLRRLILCGCVGDDFPLF